MKPSFKKGFSIIELIFVIAVLGIIAAVAVPKLMDSRSNALITTIKQDITTITSSIQSYHMMNNKIDKISNSVNINTTTWDVTDLKAIFNSDNKTCVVIDVSDNKITVLINEDSSTLCQKLYDTGVRNSDYELY